MNSQYTIIFKYFFILASAGLIAGIVMIILLALIIIGLLVDWLFGDDGKTEIVISSFIIIIVRRDLYHQKNLVCAFTERLCPIFVSGI